MDFPDQLDHLEATIRSAKAMPMSASCLVNRAEMLVMVERLRGALPANLDHANAVLAERDAVLATGREKAERIVEAARGEREQLIDESDVLAEGRARAAAMTSQARADSTRLLADADSYVDGKLAEFEVLLDHLGSQVNNGRLRLTARRAADLAHFEGTDRGAAHGTPQGATQATAQGAAHSSTARGDDVRGDDVHGDDVRADDVHPVGPAESSATLDPALVGSEGPAAVDASLGTR